MVISIGYIRSSRPQTCYRCGREIRAREESVKYVYRSQRRGDIYTRTRYVCAECERVAADSAVTSGGAAADTMLPAT